MSQTRVARRNKSVPPPRLRSEAKCSSSPVTASPQGSPVDYPGPQQQALYEAPRAEPAGVPTNGMPGIDGSSLWQGAAFDGATAPSAAPEALTSEHDHGENASRYEA